MDGIRGYWNGEKLVSRHAKYISCPDWFLEALPKGTKLDGELWMGRESFEKTLAILNSKDPNSWKPIKFVIFDSPVAGKPYEIRIKELEQLKLPSFVTLIDIKLCSGNEELMREVNSIVRNGGEGIIVTKPDSLYLAERTTNRLKVKVTLPENEFYIPQLYQDSEVQLLEIVPTGFFSLQ